MDLQKLEAFASISEHRNLSKASVALGTLPSVVSRHISALERECGGKLFRRTGRGMDLTDLGRRLLPRVQATLNEYRGLLQDIRSQHGRVSGEVRIGLVPSLAQAVAASLFRDVQQHYPAVHLQLLEGVTAQIDAWRVSELIDITVLFRARNGASASEDALGEVDTYLVGPKGDPVTSASAVRFRELAGLPLVLAAMPNGLRADIEREARAQGIPLTIVLETNSLAIQSELAARGGAYTIMAGHAARQRMAAGLQASRLVEPTIVRTIAMGVVSHGPAGTATHHVARLTRMHLEEAFRTIAPPFGPEGVSPG